MEALLPKNNGNLLLIESNINKVQVRCRIQRFSYWQYMIKEINYINDLKTKLWVIFIQTKITVILIISLNSLYKCLYQLFILLQK